MLFGDVEGGGYSEVEDVRIFGILGIVFGMVEFGVFGVGGWVWVVYRKEVIF